MNNRESFLHYLNTCVKSTRSTQNNPLYLAGNAPKDYARFLEPDRLFDYNPEKWKGFDMFSIDDPDEAERIFFELYNDRDFQKRNNNDNQGWRQGAISHYVCYLRAKNYFRKNNQEDVSSPSKTISRKDLPLQQIHYGAPGTGKSFGIDEEIKRNKYKSIRTTFHPDSDYSTFVGCYKPQMETVTVRDDRGFPVKENGQTVYKKEIVYKYSPQAFLKAYVKAWKNPKDSVVLVIEEINRGNCAQIFGDIFQLLDRNVDGYSSYPIQADEDILQYLNSEFDGLTIADADKIDAMYEDAVVEDIINGSKLLLPPNLYIWATMNTSDQSLFPIDSAFKRRWDWKYIRISEGRDKKTGALIKNTIKVDDAHSYDWWEFLKAINTAIGNTTMSEDKKLGFFFCKATNNVIDAELFVAKVVFYLWNDVFKDADTDLFNVLDDGNEPTFDQFYTEDTITGNTIVNKDVVVKFIEKVMKSVE